MFSAPCICLTPYRRFRFLFTTSQLILGYHFRPEGVGACRCGHSADTTHHGVYFNTCCSCTTHKPPEIFLFIISSKPITAVFIVIWILGRKSGENWQLLCLDGKAKLAFASGYFFVHVFRVIYVENFSSELWVNWVFDFSTGGRVSLPWLIFPV